MGTSQSAPVETKAVALRDPSEVSASDFMPVLSVAQAVERKAMINQFIGDVMRDGEDYGTIPGASTKKVLLKPGAEKLCSIFGLAVTYTEDKIIEDWTGEEHGGEPLFYYSYRCQLSRGGRFMGEAIGSCNSWESKYRYRWVPEEQATGRADFDRLIKRGGRVSKFEPDFALDKKQTDGAYGKPAEYWALFEQEIQAGRAKQVRRKMGKKEFDGWEIQMDQTQYRIPNPEIADVINTVQKMAQKRAIVAAILVVTNCSDAFTQDLDDFEQPPVNHPAQNGFEEPPRQAPTVTVRATPPELVETFRRIRESTANIKPAFIKLCDLLIEKAGAAGNAEYERITKQFKSDHPNSHSWRPADVEGCMLDLWDALQTISPVGTYNAVDEDVPY